MAAGPASTKEEIVGKLLMGTLLVLGLTATTRQIWQSVLDDDALDYEGIYAEARRIDDRIRAHRALTAVRDATLRTLGEGKITLREACARVVNASNELFPMYVQSLMDWVPGHSLEERMADNLISHFQELIRRGAAPADALPGLERQLAD